MCGALCDLLAVLPPETSPTHAQALIGTRVCFELHVFSPGGGGGDSAAPRTPTTPPPPLGASSQQLVAKGVALRRPWAPKAPDTP